MIKLYGIPNCDTVKRAKDKLYHLGANEFEFINFKFSPPTAESILRWKKSFDDNWPVNEKSRVFRDLKEQFEKASDNEKLKIIQENPSIIKRPILEIHGKVISVGFNEEKYTKAIRLRDQI